MEMILRLLLRRLMALPVMILGVTALVFVVLQFTPGDPATVALIMLRFKAALSHTVKPFFMVRRAPFKFTIIILLVRRPY